MKYSLTCPVCNKVYAGTSNVFSCPDCDAPTVVAMNLESDIAPGDEHSLWRWFDLLPLLDRECIVSQGEGLTPLVDAPRLGEELGVARLLLKNETVNPTGAFKDRQVSVGISKAQEDGAHTIAVVSSGNVAAAAASYAAVAGMTCYVFTPANAPDDRLVQARMYGAKFYRVDTLSSSLIFELVDATCRARGWHLLSTAGLYNPCQVEGAKTIAYELAEQADPLPDWIIAPVGGGGLLGAMWRGFKELLALGKIAKIPALVGVQSSACTPLLKALAEGLTPDQVVANPVPVGNTIAGAIADDILFDAYTVLPAIRETGGCGVAVTDNEMLAAETRLAMRAGIFAEPTGAAPVAALAKLRAEGVIADEDSVCCVVTGAGFKDFASAKQIVKPPRLLEPTENAFMRIGYE